MDLKIELSNIKMGNFESVSRETEGKNRFKIYMYYQHCLKVEWAKF